MSKPLLNPDLLSLNLKAKVLASPAYQERCNLLFDLFCLSRDTDKDPKKILAIQAGLAEILIGFQKKKAEFKQEDNEIGVAVVKRLILILKQIVDSIVWRILRHDRVLIQLLAEHHQIGDLDDTLFGDFAMAQEIIEQEGAIVIVNDLTTILRHADLTIIGKDNLSLAETKYGKAAKRNTGSIRQRKRLEELLRFLNTGIRITKDRRDLIFKIDLPIKTHHAVVTEAIDQAREKSYHKILASDCVAIEALWTKNKTHKFPKKRPFEGAHTMRFHNLQIFNKPGTRVVPYGVFPFDHKNCFDLVTGDVIVLTTLNLDCLQTKYNQFGLEFNIPQSNEQEAEKYLSASIAERKKLMPGYKFIVRDSDYGMYIAPDTFAQIGLEFIHEDTFVQSYRQLLNLIKELNIPDDKTTRFYSGYKNESQIWI